MYNRLIENPSPSVFKYWSTYGCAQFIYSGQLSKALLDIFT